MTTNTPVMVRASRIRNLRKRAAIGSAPAQPLSLVLPRVILFYLYLGRRTLELSCDWRHWTVMKTVLDVFGKQRNTSYKFPFWFQAQCYPLLPG